MEDVSYLDISSNSITVSNLGMGIWADSIGGWPASDDGAHHCTVRNNYIANTGTSSHGINWETTELDQLYYNVVDMRGGNDAWALWVGVAGNSVSGDASTAIYNNTFLTAGGGITAQFGWTGYSHYLKNLTVKNNIFVFSGASGAIIAIQKLDTADNGHVFDYNLCFDSGTAAYHIGWFGSSYANLANFKAAHPTQEIHGLESDPYLVAGGDAKPYPFFYPRSYSPVITPMTG